ncbi:hypothetical protein CEXT_449641 [Caerostris extrusa]|uniref:Uncharacterized protein n=1 Tax=Caerostris extrusa TaxID=172846 RepID=A0AAV4WNI0_CAEEX|nr:hypothetical protein CEXT_449641 [Caerostris extrusa]
MNKGNHDDEVLTYHGGEKLQLCGAVPRQTKQGADRCEISRIRSTFDPKSWKKFPENNISRPPHSNGIKRRLLR